MLTIFGWNFEIEERCKGVHCVDLGGSFPTSIYLQKSASIQPRTSPSKFGGNYSILFNRVLTAGAAAAAGGAFSAAAFGAGEGASGLAWAVSLRTFENLGLGGQGFSLYLSGSLLPVFFSYFSCKVVHVFKFLNFSAQFYNNYMKWYKMI